MTDLWRSHFGHPILPAGYNADDNNGDEVDGAGTNWSIWPNLFDTFQGLKTLVITGDMMDVFETTCPDYIVPSVNNIITWPMENQQIAMLNVWRTYAVPAAGNVIVLQATPRETMIRPEPDTANIAQGDQSHTIRRKA